MSIDHQRRVERGQQAEAILENEFFREMAEQVRKECFDAFKGGDEVAAMQARQEIRAFEAFLTKIAQVKSQGMDSANQLRNLRERERDNLSVAVNNIQGIA